MKSTLIIPFQQRDVIQTSLWHLDWKSEILTIYSVTIWFNLTVWDEIGFKWLFNIPLTGNSMISKGVVC